ncbi:hypothetical protein ACJX0J_031209, partial [Zea mays]
MFLWDMIESNMDMHLDAKRLQVLELSLIIQLHFMNNPPIDKSYWPQELGTRLYQWYVFSTTTTLNSHGQKPDVQDQEVVTSSPCEQEETSKALSLVLAEKIIARA